MGKLGQEIEKKVKLTEDGSLMGNVMTNYRD